MKWRFSLDTTTYDFRELITLFYKEYNGTKRDLTVLFDGKQMTGNIVHKSISDFDEITVITRTGQEEEMVKLLVPKK